jgi:hypothetical protein
MTHRSEHEPNVDPTPPTCIGSSLSAPADELVRGLRQEGEVAHMTHMTHSTDTRQQTDDPPPPHTHTHTCIGSSLTAPADELVRGLRQKGEVAPTAGSDSNTSAQVAGSFVWPCVV